MNQFNNVYSTITNDTFAVSLAPFKKSSTKAFAYRPVIIDGIESICIEYNYGEPTKGSIRRVEVAISSYIKSNKAYFSILDTFYSSQLDSLSVDIIKGMKITEIHAYKAGKKRYLTIEGDYDGAFCKFAVFDKQMILSGVKIANALHKKRFGRADCILVDLFGLDHVT